jgi:protein-S-isoprenylcysteine O-methyltransferase Ste14
MMHPGPIMIALWITWGISWLLAALWTNRTEARVARADVVRYRVPMIVGTLLMAVPARGTEGALRLWHVGWISAWTCVAATALGIAFAWWARLHLGRLWSGLVTRKTDHRVVDSGPYAIVRHPIYTGLLFSLFATAAIKGTLPGVVGFGFLLTAFWLKARLEESWLSRELDVGAYAAYRRRVPMLIPLGPKGA